MKSTAAMIAASGSRFDGPKGTKLKVHGTQYYCEEIATQIEFPRFASQSFGRHTPQFPGIHVGAMRIAAGKKNQQGRFFT